MRSWLDRFSKYILDPRRNSHKYLLQLLLCLFLSGPMFFDNFFNACTTDIIQRLNVSHEDFSLLISIPSFTGVLCGAIAGIVTMYGSTLTAAITAIASFIGAIIVCYGIETFSYSTVMAGRFIFVLSWNLLAAVQKVIIFRQFKGKTLVFIFGLKVVAIRIGAVSGLYFSGTIVAEMDNSLTGSFYYALVLSGISLICTLLFSYLRRGTNTARIIMPLLVGSRRNRSRAGSANDSAGDTGNDELSSHTETTYVAPTASTDQFSVRALFDLPMEAWLCCLVIFLYYGGLVPFETFGVDYLITQYGFTREAAGRALALVPFFSFFSPLLTPVLNTVKVQVLAVTVCQCLVAVGIIGNLMHLPHSPELYLSVIGLGHLVVANAVWLALAGVCHTETQKTNAASISSAIYALSAFTFNWVTGIVRDTTGDYDKALLVMCILIFLGGFAALYLAVYGQHTVTVVRRNNADIQRMLLGGSNSTGENSPPDAIILNTNPSVIDNHFARE